MHYVKYVLVAIAFALLGAVSYHADTNLSDTPGFSCTSPTQHSIATDNNNRVHVLWTESSLFPLNECRPANPQLDTVDLYYRRSLDNGATWQDPVPLTTAVTEEFPSTVTTAIATDGQDVVHLAWEDWRDGGYSEIYYKHSTDGGATWSGDTRLTTTDSISSAPLIAVADAITHLLWQENSESRTEFYYQHSTDNGTTWSSAQKLIDADVMSIQGNTLYPSFSVAALGNTVHLAWNSGSDDTLGDIYYKRSSDGGNTWDTDVHLISDLEGSLAPSIAASGTLVGLVWTQSNLDTLNPKSFVCFKRSTDGGATWSDQTIISDTTRLAFFFSDNPQIAISNQLVAVVWGAVDAITDSMAQIYFTSSTDGGVTWSEETALAPEDVHASFPSLSIDPSGAVHIVWCDDRDAPLVNFDVYYTKQQIAGTAENPNKIGLRALDLESYPNLFRRTTRIAYTLPKNHLVHLRIFDANGRLVHTLVNEYQTGGSHTVDWDGKNGYGQNVGEGVYLVQLVAGNAVASEKIILLK